jgi:MarR family 2-MHQ and catechol resistance regulon transcriptional repressor
MRYIQGTHKLPSNASPWGKGNEVQEAVQPHNEKITPARSGDYGSDSHKAMRALTKYATAGVEEAGLGLSDFGVLELMLHGGPLPVNTIGPIVDLTPGSISIAVDRIVAKGLVSRVESAENRRVRIVALTPRGKDLIDSAFRKHSGQTKKVFSELSPEELRGLEGKLKKRRASCRAHGEELSGFRPRLYV